MTSFPHPLPGRPPVEVVERDLPAGVYAVAVLEPGRDLRAVIGRDVPPVQRETIMQRTLDAALVSEAEQPSPR